MQIMPLQATTLQATGAIGEVSRSVSKQLCSNDQTHLSNDRFASFPLSTDIHYHFQLSYDKLTLDDIEQ